MMQILNVNYFNYFYLIVKQKNKILKEKLNKYHKRPSIDLENKRSNFFKRRSLHLPLKLQNNESNQIIEKDKIFDIDKSNISDSPKPALKSSYSLKLPLKSKSFAYRLKV